MCARAASISGVRLHLTTAAGSWSASVIRPRQPRKPSCPLNLLPENARRQGTIRFQGERIDHVDGMTIEESEHMMATRLYQNTARVHFNQQAEKAGRFGRRLIYGGYIISLARSLSFNGLANAFSIAAINAGRHVSPAFAGDTVYAWSEVIDKLALPGRNDLGALRLRSVATKDQPCANFPYKIADGGYDPSVLLDFDYTVLMPRRA